MALIVKDRVKQAAAAPGTGTVTLGATPTGFQSFAAVGNTNTTYFAIVDPVSGDWEVNYGVYTSSGTTLTRNATPLSSSNSGALVNFTGAVDVFVTYPSEKAVYEDTAGVVTFTDNPILSGGTANGVLYLNGSKVATSGSALTFNGTTLGVPQIVQSGSGTYGSFNSSGAGNAWASYQYAGSEIGEIGQGSGIISGGSNTDFGIRATNNLVFAVSYNEGMRLTSSSLYTASGINVGIGTNNATVKLQVNQTTGTNGIRLLSSNATTQNMLQFYHDDTKAVIETSYLGSGAFKDLILNSQGGNVGIGGVTVNDWYSSWRVIQGAATAQSFAVASGGPGMYVINNAYLDSTAYWKYKTANAASYYQQYLNSHYWYRSTSTPVVGNDCVFNTSMVLNGSGNLVVGDTSAISRLDVVANTPAYLYSAGQLNVRTNEAQGANKGAMISLSGFSNAGSTVYNFGVIGGYKENGTSADYRSYMIFGTSDLYSNVIERMRINSNGYVGIGTNDPSYKLHVVVSSNDANNVLTGSSIVVGTTLGMRERGATAGISGSTYATQIYQGNSGGGNLEIYNVSSAYSLVFGTQTTERMRISAAGNVGIGTNNPSNLLHLKSETDDNIKFEDTTSGTSGYVGSSANNQSDTTATRLGIRGEAGVAFSVGSATKMVLDSSGNLLVGASNNTPYSGIFGGKLVVNAGTGTVDSAIFTVDPTNANTVYTVVVGGRSTGAVASTALMAFVDANTTGTVVGSITHNGSSIQLDKVSGITFPATASLSSNVNTLDDYEEGTWTPQIVNENATVLVSPSTALGSYTRIGNRINFNLWLVGGSLSGASTTVYVTLPFPVINSNDGYGPIEIWPYSGFTYTGQIIPRTNPGTSYVILQLTASGASTNLDSSNFSGTLNMMVGGNYMPA